MTFVGRLLRRGQDADDLPTLDPRAWREGRTSVGSKRPDGWEPEALIVRRGIRAGAAPRIAPRVVQIRVDTQ